MYLIIGEADEYIKEKIRNKYLVFASTDKNKEVLEKYTKLWDEIRYQIKAISVGEFNFVECNSIESGEYGKDYIKIKFN